MSILIFEDTRALKVQR